MVDGCSIDMIMSKIWGVSSEALTVVWQLTDVAPLEMIGKIRRKIRRRIIGKIRRRAGDQTAEILPRLMMIELPCTGRRRDGRKRKRKGGHRGGPRAGRGTIFHENSDYHLLACSSRFQNSFKPLDITSLCLQRCPGTESQSHPNWGGDPFQIDLFNSQ